MKAFLLRVVPVALVAMSTTVALAQYPTEAIKLVVPMAPGGGVDLIARIIGPRLVQLLGRPVTVDNRTGANGNIAGQMVAQSAPDGHTLLVAMDSLIVINRSLYKKMPFDSLKDLVPISTITSNQFILSINPSLPTKSLREFIEYARRATPPLAYASAGNGSQHHLLMEMLKIRAGIDLLHVPYKGGAPAMAATVAGETAAAFGGVATAASVKAGKLRALAGSGTQRSEAFPDIPTISEFYPGYEGNIWTGLFAPVGTPESIVARLRAEMNKLLAEAEVKVSLRKSGDLQAYVTRPQEFVEIIRRDAEKYAKVAAGIGLKLD